jgi:hypothetical protein
MGTLLNTVYLGTRPAPQGNSPWEAPTQHEFGGMKDPGNLGTRGMKLPIELAMRTANNEMCNSP